MGRETVGSRIRAARKKAGLSQGGLGATVGLSAGMICHIEKNRKGVSYDVARVLARVLRLSWKDIYTGKVPARIMAQIAADAQQCQR